jgi:hypothetical protein
MSNIVDTSTETVNAEFDAVAETLGADQPETSQVDQAQQAALEEAQQKVEIEMAAGMIATALRFSISGLVSVDVAEQTYDDTAAAYAVLIIKYFPGGIFSLLDRYKEEIGAVTASFVLIKVVRDAKKQKLAREAEAKAESEKNRKAQPMATQTQPESKEIN